MLGVAHAPRVGDQVDGRQVGADRDRQRPDHRPEGLAQLVQMSPAALPSGTRPEAIPPRAAPRKKGVSTEAMAKVAP